MLRRLIILAALVAAGVWYLGLPMYWQAQTKIYGVIRDEHHVNAMQADDETKGIVEIAKRTHKITDNPTLINSIMPSADRARDLERTRKAWDARAADRDEFIPQAEVWGNQTDWNTVAEIRVPTRIIVSPADEITPPFRPQEKTNADGRPFDPIKHKYDRTVLMQERFEHHLPMVNTGNVDQLIGRFYDNGAYTQGFPIGTDSVLCVGPGLYNGGQFQAWRNGLAVMDQVPMSLDFANTPGKYRLRIQPDDPAKGELFATEICAAHPGVLVIKLQDMQTQANGGNQ